MSISDQHAGTQLWLAVTRDVTPLNHRSVEQPAVPFDIAIRLPPIRHTLDLHGMATADAHMAVIEFVQACRSRYRFVTIITGISGAIRQEFQHWIADMPDIRRVEVMPGGGASRLHFRKLTTDANQPQDRRRR